jgi:hypothetical protein
MRRMIVVGAVLAAAAIAGCANASSAGPAPASSVPAAPTTTTAPLAQTGQTLSDGGVTLTVKSARVTDSIDMNESNFRPGSGYEVYTKTKPDAGGMFVVVEAHVVNNAKVSMDLTCGLPVTTKIADDQDRNFDPIQDLYKLKGNPECNKQLQPGFEADMTWVYLVPTTATVVRWGFYDSTELTGAEQWTRVQLTV